MSEFSVKNDDTSRRWLIAAAVVLVLLIVSPLLFFLLKVVIFVGAAIFLIAWADSYFSRRPPRPRKPKSAGARKSSAIEAEIVKKPEKKSSRKEDK